VKWLMPKFNKLKLEQAILYFAQKIPASFASKVKLLKLLYYLDFDHYEKYGSSVSGDTYLRFDLGPVPKHANRILKEMEESHKLRVREYRIKREGYKARECYEALVEPDLSVFSETEFEMLKSVVQRFKYWTGNQMKIATHGEAPWRLTGENREIDYRLAHYRDSWGESTKELAEEEDAVLEALQRSNFFERATEELRELSVHEQK